MQKLFKPAFLLLLLISLGSRCFSQNTAIVELYNDSLPYQFSNSWAYNINDDSLFAQPGYNDKNWKRINPELDIEEAERNNFKGFAWLRCWVRIPAELVNKTFSFSIKHNGASTVYVDGKEVANFGQPSVNGNDEVRFNPDKVDFPVVLHDSTLHLIAFKYSNHKYKQYRKWDEFNAGLQLTVSLYENQIFQLLTQQSLSAFILIAIAGFLFSLTVMHLFFFFFNRRQKEHIYYSGFTFFFALFFTLLHFNHNSFYPDFDIPLGYFTPMVIPLYLIFLAGFLSSLIIKKLPKLFWLSVFVGLAIFSGFFYTTGFNDVLYAVLIFLVNYQCFTVLSIGKKEKIEGIKIIYRGFLFFFLLLSAIGVMYLLTLIGNFKGNVSLSGPIGFVILCFILMCILSIPISISLYLARNFASINTSLEKKLIEVEELSTKMIEQEKEKKKMLEDQNQMLEQQVTERTEELFQKNKDITDSIKYAKRIQTSYLPTNEIITKALPQSFVFYKPKDIVSGDFYWLHADENATYIAAADCTGHGVPGAMVSLMANEMLNRCVKEFNLTEPGEILDKTRELLIESFSKGNEDIKDGMDISFLKIITDNSNDEVKIEWSGANNPLWIIKNNVPEEFKADKMPVGKQSGSVTSFTTQQITLNKGTRVYLFTDGYADQFGGPKGKKFKYKQLSQLLTDSASQPITNQKTILEKEMNTWMNAIEQVDDMLIIGIEV